MSEPPNPAPIKKKNHIWIYFFVFVFVASVGLTVLLIKFNLYIQLTPDQIEEAREVWKESNIKNYDMVYSTKTANDKEPSNYVVKVRGGKVMEVRMKGDLLPKEQFIYHSMDSQFKYIERFMDMDQKPNAPKVFAIARFDPQNGALLYYVRRVMGTSERVEINVKLTVVD